MLPRLFNMAFAEGNQNMKSYLFLLLPVLALSLFSCKRNDGGEGTTVTPSTGYRTLEEALASSAPKLRTTGLIVATGDTLYGAGGTRIMIPPNAFETLTGGRVTGSVNISYQDWVLKGDMVYGHVLPISYGTPLTTSGQAFLSATQNGVPLRVSKDTEVVFQFPQYMMLPGGVLQGWTGRTQASATNIVNWLPLGDKGKLRPIVLADSVNLIADTLGYVAASGEFPTTERINFTVRVNSPVALESSLAVALYTGVRAVYPLPYVTNSRILAANIPQGPMSIAVMGVNKGLFYGGIVEVPSPGSDSTYQVNLISTDPAKFRLDMNAL